MGMLVKKGVLTPLPNMTIVSWQELTLEMLQELRVEHFLAHQRGSTLCQHLKEFKDSWVIGWIQKNFQKNSKLCFLVVCQDGLCILFRSVWVRLDQNYLKLELRSLTVPMLL